MAVKLAVTRDDKRTQLVRCTNHVSKNYHHHSTLNSKQNPTDQGISNQVTHCNRNNNKVNDIGSEPTEAGREKNASVANIRRDKWALSNRPDSTKGGNTICTVRGLFLFPSRSGGNWLLNLPKTNHGKMKLLVYLRSMHIFSFHVANSSTRLHMASFTPWKERKIG